jgi:hypothetical protein
MSQTSHPLTESEILRNSDEDYGRMLDSIANMNMIQWHNLKYVERSLKEKSYEDNLFGFVFTDDFKNLKRNKTEYISAFCIILESTSTKDNLAVEEYSCNASLSLSNAKWSDVAEKLKFNKENQKMLPVLCK